ncbi:MAG: aminopeptidase [Prevotellaceae bacterium]|nr:aminopeptidase [Prevotellaceae bacterium]
MKQKFLLLLLLVCLYGTTQGQTDTTAVMRMLLHAEGVQSVEPLHSEPYAEKYVVRLTQNVNGDTADKGTFSQRLIVGVKGLDRPTVMVTEGYFAHYALRPDYEEELSRLFDANVIVCEYRYFGESKPLALLPKGRAPEAATWDDYWQYMTVANSLRDLHHVRQSLGSVFTGKWLSTGISKGGQTTMFYRATYPDDVDVSVSYVAPLNRAVEDGRHETFLARTVGTKAERKAVRRAQQEMLRRKARLLPRFEQYAADHHYRYNAPAADIYDYCVLEFPFALWQWGTPVSTIPSVKADDDTWFDYFVETAGPDYFQCPSDFTPFHVQAMHELGYYGYSTRGLHHMSVTDTRGYLPRLMLPRQLQQIPFDDTLYRHTVNYLKENDPRHIFIYGEIDPWTASGVADWLDCSSKQNMRVYVQPRGSHRTRIGTMPEQQRTEIMSRLTKWLTNE